MVDYQTPLSMMPSIPPDYATLAMPMPLCHGGMLCAPPGLACANLPSFLSFSIVLRPRPASLLGPASNERAPVGNFRFSVTSNVEVLVDVCAHHHLLVEFPTKTRRSGSSTQHPEKRDTTVEQETTARGYGHLTRCKNIIDQGFGNLTLNQTQCKNFGANFIQVIRVFGDQESFTWIPYIS
mmetsp:Transcript_50205/g.151123  ORF Transcript_50205/g.151123 Transcript_50205/m.151123 type:complete len:181 (+) Transcript_50205:123-665(+)